MTDRSGANWWLGIAIGLVGMLGVVPLATAHIIPPEDLHPVAEAYRRCTFALNLNPVPWELVRTDVESIEHWLRTVDTDAADRFDSEYLVALGNDDSGENRSVEAPSTRERKRRAVFELCTRAVGRALTATLEQAIRVAPDRKLARTNLRSSQAVLAAFADTLPYVDPEAHRILGEAFLAASDAMGSDGLMSHGGVPFDVPRFRSNLQTIAAYIRANFGDDFAAGPDARLSPRPLASPTHRVRAVAPRRLPPGANLNKQLPRPRQILNMTARGVDESQTPLIALGDMAFDSAYIFGEPARSLAMSCNTCHNKGVTNPNFVVPGISSRPGGMDVSNSFFAGHANNGHFDPLDIPDLRGIRFTAPYGRNGRFSSLREFVRNVIVNEFNGPEPDPMLLDGIIAYMNEFDFLPNPHLNPDGTLAASASDAARRGEVIFRRPFPQMADRSCATCHVPSANFVDHQRHDLGTVNGHELYSMDRAMDTPTLLSSAYTAPYFHDGSQPTLRAVNEWFNTTFGLGLTERDLSDLTAYVQTVGDGIDAYEDSVYYLDAEMEEFSFFLSAFEFLAEKNKPELMNATFQTIALEIRNHKWELQDYAHLPTMEALAELMDDAYEANQADDGERVVASVEAYRRLYAANVEGLK